MNETKHNQREILLNIICNYYEVEKKDLMEAKKIKQWVMGNAVGMFAHICDQLGIGTTESMAKHINRSMTTMRFYVLKNKFEHNQPEEFRLEKNTILKIFFQGQKSIFTEYYMRLVPKEKMPEFIDYLNKFSHIKNPSN